MRSFERESGLRRMVKIHRLPRELLVAVLAGLAPKLFKLSGVNIGVARLASVAITLEHDLLFTGQRKGAMAFEAANRLMCARKLPLRLAVIEFAHLLPAVSSMASIAGDLAAALFPGMRVSMTPDTALVFKAEASIHWGTIRSMALLTRCCGMATSERKFRFLMLF